MSNWDFGHRRQEPADPRQPRYPREAGWPAGDGYAGNDGEPYDDPAAAPYPITYERDDFNGHPPWSAGPQRPAPPAPPGPWQPGPPRPWQPGPRRGAPRQEDPRPTSPGRAMPQRPDPRQAGTWQTGPWSAAAERPAPLLTGGRGYAGRRGSAGTGGRHSADPMRAFRPGTQPGEEPWLDAHREPALDGPWWDPDSWPDWRRWLIPVGVAVLAAAIGAALVLLTGIHPGASAAVGAARATTAVSRAPSHPNPNHPSQRHPSRI